MTLSYFQITQWVAPLFLALVGLLFVGAVGLGLYLLHRIYLDISASRLANRMRAHISQYT